MLHQIIRTRTRDWCQSDDCTLRWVLDYIRERGALRQPQIEAIETYLFLKSVGENKPLKDLFAEGFFSEELDLDAMNINVAARDLLQRDRAAYALFCYAHQTGATQVKQAIIEQREGLDYKEIINQMFYGVSYPDYLMSLPMGAGKTYLMAALIYLDLYLAEMAPDDKDLAQNFLILIPNAQKSSIGPSLQTINHFDAEWVLPPQDAARIKRNIQFTVLDAARSRRGSMRTKNPNALEVELALRSRLNHIFVVNAEKVILNRLPDGQRPLDKLGYEDQRANELRDRISKLPRLGIFIDEVHHATDSDIKLRQVVNHWCNARDNQITTVLGFSGTPYLTNGDTINVNKEVNFRLGQISNTVYYYSLLEGVRNFLKQPQIRTAEGLKRSDIIRSGVEEFRQQYGTKTYADLGIAKLAIYCPSIPVLEKEVYPLLCNELQIVDHEILRYHRGNKEYRQPQDSDRDFRALDTTLSPHRYILLVGIGREGWDCRSLTGVILAQEGDCRKNMVLQTCCRCLRQVEGEQATARIWLSAGNAKLLKTQLDKQQKTTIEEINNPGRGDDDQVQRHSRMQYLELPEVDFYQLRVRYTKTFTEETANTATKLKGLLKELEEGKLRDYAVIRRGELEDLGGGVQELVRTTGTEPAQFTYWLLQLSKESFATISVDDLENYKKLLDAIFTRMTYKHEGSLVWNDVYHRVDIHSRIRLCFRRRRRLETKSETVPVQANLLRIENLKPVKKDDRIFPSRVEQIKQILKLDATNETGAQVEAKNIKVRKILQEQGIDPSSSSTMLTTPLAVRHKESTLHYLPYHFAQSELEKDFLKEVLGWQTFHDQKLEIYYNGARGLTHFGIDCYAKDNGNWRSIGRYTTDFLIIKRKNKKIHKMMMVETKGTGYATAFAERRDYMKNEFVPRNNAKFKYNRFDFVYLQDNVTMSENMHRLDQHLRRFFIEP